MENSNNILFGRITEIVLNKNYFLFVLLLCVFTLIPISFSGIRDNFGLAPLILSSTIFLVSILLRYSVRNSINYLSYKNIFSIILINLSFYIVLGSFSYVSSSNFSFDYSLSGKYGEFLAKSPYYWNSYNAGILNYIDIIFRTSLPLFVILVIYKPDMVKKILFNFFKSIITKIFELLKIIINKIDIKKIRPQRKFFEDKITPEVDIKKKSIQNSLQSKNTNEIINKNITVASTEEIPNTHDDLLDEKNINFTNDNNVFEMKKITTVKEDFEDNKIDKFRYEKLKWPRIDTSNLMVSKKEELSKDEITDTKKIIINTLAAHGVNTTIEKHTSGPSVTMYQLKPGWVDENEKKRVKVEQVLRREKDLALALGSPNIRFEAVLDGVQNSMGIEIPNLSPNTVDFKEVIEFENLKDSEKYLLPAPLGQGMDGIPRIIDLSRMPHLLVAGSTGSGKSVFINSIITGLLSTRKPDDVRMVLIDPKRVELTPYANIPHLYTEDVIVDTEKAVSVLSATVEEMMVRFKILEKVGVKNILDFNKKMSKSHKMWNILVVIDELADLMLQAGSEIERLIVRLAQLGRATGIHLVVATQRPSVDVVTGLIKANFPSRVSFAVMSQIDSRTVLDGVGAEKLIGKGDMLFSPIDNAQMSRIQGVLLTENDIQSITSQWEPYNEKYPLEMLEILEEENINNTQISGDSLYEQAVDLSSQSKTLSTSLLQRRLRIGYPRAARLMDELEENGIVGPGEAGKPRRVLVG